MAVKKIHNKHLVDTATINRGKQTSTRNSSTARDGGNRSKTVIPGKDFTKNYAITLKDVDTSIISHIKNVMKPTVREAGEMIQVPVFYGNEERWVAARKRNVLRDKKGALILPLIMLKRTSVDRNDTLVQGMEHDVKREHIEVVRNNKWSKTNKYDRFSVQTGKKPVEENYVTTMPNFVNITYEFIAWTSYIEQMNSLIESFVEQNYNYWGNSTEYKFLATTDSISDASEMTVDSERIIKSTFSLIVKAYLLPEYTNSVVTNKISNLQKRLTPSKVTFGYEGDATNEQINPDK